MLTNIEIKPAHQLRVAMQLVKNAVEPVKLFEKIKHSEGVVLVAASKGEYSCIITCDTEAERDAVRDVFMSAGYKTPQKGFSRMSGSFFVILDWS